MKAGNKPSPVAERLDFNIECIMAVAKTLPPEQLVDLTQRMESIAWTFCYPPKAPGTDEQTGS